MRAIEGAVEPRRAGAGLQSHPALLAAVVKKEAVSPHHLDVLLVRVENDDAIHLPLHIRRRDAADGASADDEHASPDHASPPSRPASTGGSRLSNSFNAA